MKDEYSYENEYIYDKTIESKWGKYTYEIEKDVIKRAIEMCNKRESVIELGCGDGRWIKILSQNGWGNIVGTEITQKYLNDLDNTIPNFKGIFVELDKTDIPAASNSQDLICAVEVEPINHALWFYSEGHRVLKTNGYLVGFLTNKSSLRGFLYKLAQKIIKNRWYQQLSYNHSYLYWENIIKENGFQIVFSEGFCWFPFSRRSNSFLVPFFVKLECLLGLRKVVKYSPWIMFIAKKI